jgi:cell division protein FtsW
MRQAATVLICIVLALVAVGLVVLYSSSSARELHDVQVTAGAHALLLKQLQWGAVSLLAAVVVAKIDYRFWRYMAPLVVLGAIVLLALVLVMGDEKNGSTRWLTLAGFQFQPSEVGKFALVVGMAAWIAQFRRRMGRFWVGFVIPCIPFGLMVGLVLLEPDYGTTFVLAVVGLLMLYLGGTRWFYLVPTTLGGATMLSVMIALDDERRGRFLAFLYPDKYPDDAYHMLQSLKAIISGGGLGRGLGESLQKHAFLPEAHTDFIFAVLAEELGVVASFLVLALFLGYFVCGLTIAMRARDPFGRYLAAGISILMLLQATFNIAVVTGCVPTKGLPLPFISYGGSSMLISMVLTAVLLSIAQHADVDDGGSGSGREAGWLDAEA